MSTADIYVSNNFCDDPLDPCGNIKALPPGHRANDRDLNTPVHCSEKGKTDPDRPCDDRDFRDTDAFMVPKGCTYIRSERANVYDQVPGSSVGARIVSDGHWVKVDNNQTVSIDVVKC